MLKENSPPISTWENINVNVHGNSNIPQQNKENINEIVKVLSTKQSNGGIRGQGEITQCNQMVDNQNNLSKNSSPFAPQQSPVASVSTVLSNSLLTLAHVAEESIIRNDAAKRKSIQTTTKIGEKPDGETFLKQVKGYWRFCLKLYSLASFGVENCFADLLSNSTVTPSQEEIANPNHSDDNNVVPPFIEHAKIYNCEDLIVTQNNEINFDGKFLNVNSVVLSDEDEFKFINEKGEEFVYETL